MHHVSCHMQIRWSSPSCIFVTYRLLTTVKACGRSGCLQNLTDKVTVCWQPDRTSCNSTHLKFRERGSDSGCQRITSVTAVAEQLLSCMHPNPTAHICRCEEVARHALQAPVVVVIAEIPHGVLMLTTGLSIRISTLP